MKKVFGIFFGGLMCVTCLVVGAPSPNILVILADDLGYGDTGFTGSTEIRTPRLNALAANGMICENGYVTHPYCGPSRAGLITGRYQARFGMEVNCTYSPFDLQMGLPLSEKTFGQRMQEVGYRTGIIGKWHLGAAAPYHPNQRGFDYFYGFLSGGHGYFPSGVTSTHPLLLENGSPHYAANEGYFLPLVRNENAAEFNEYLTRALSRDAARFVRESEKAFCLFLSYNAPHGPLEAPKETIAKYRHIEDWNRRVYAAMIDEMDQGIGWVIDALEASDKLSNTLIIFLSDNGGVSPKVGHEFENWANNKPFREGKGSFLEGGIHVPFLVHWPAVLPSGETFDGLVSALDIAPTMVAAAGGLVGEDEFDGVNLLPFLMGSEQRSPHEALFWREGEGACWAVRTPEAKFVKSSWDASELELYTMENDPYEVVNRVAEEGDLCNRLAALWNEWNQENEPTVLLQSYEYQKERMLFYSELYLRLKEKADQRKPISIP
jgi:arylsulfatase A-like enzyme